MSEKQYKLVKCTINGEYRETMVDVRASLTDMLRNDYRLTSVKKGCEVGECGACNVIIDGECFNSCIYLAVWADGKNIRTLESLLGPNGELSDIQQAFIDETAVQMRILHTGSDHECSGDFRVRQRIYKRRITETFIRTPVPLYRI